MLGAPAAGCVGYDGGGDGGGGVVVDAVVGAVVGGDDVVADRACSGDGMGYYD